VQRRAWNGFVKLNIVEPSIGPTAVAVC